MSPVARSSVQQPQEGWWKVVPKRSGARSQEEPTTSEASHRSLKSWRQPKGQLQMDQPASMLVASRLPVTPADLFAEAEAHEPS